MQKAYVKGYYGYKNLGDELLLIGVLDYIKNKLDIQELQIEVKDKERARERQENNVQHFPQGMSISRVSTPSMLGKITHMCKSLFGFFPLLILGGGEVVNTTAKFPHNGVNYLLMYLGNIARQNYMLLGGIHTQGKNDQLAKAIISQAKKIVVREEGSYEQAKIWNNNVTLYQDFAKQLIVDVYQSSQSTFKKENYILINVHPSKIGEKTRQAINQFLQKNQGKEVYFVPCDMDHDMSFYEEVLKRYPHRRLFDRTLHNINEVVRFFAQASGARGMRLHFLLLCKECAIPFETIVYHPKVKKVLGIES